jgi:hypothetical protein
MKVFNNPQINKDGNGNLSITTAFHKNWYLIIIGILIIVFTISVYKQSLENYRFMNSINSYLQTEQDAMGFSESNSFSFQMPKAKMSFRQNFIFALFFLGGLGLIASSFGQEVIKLNGKTLEIDKQIAFISNKKIYDLKQNTTFSYNSTAKDVYPLAEFSKPNKFIFPFSSKLGKVKFQHQNDDVFIGLNISEDNAQSLVSMFNQQVV